MKKILFVLMCLAMVASLAACGFGDVGELIESPEQKKANFEDFRKSLEQQNAVALDAEVLVQEDGSSMLIADVKNNTTFELTEIKIAFAGWKATGTPAALSYEDGNPYYVVETDMKGLVIEGSQRWYADMGLEINWLANIDYVEAIVMSYKANGTLWENPLYEQWGKYFNGETLEDYMKLPEPTVDDLNLEYEDLKTQMAKQNALAAESGLYPQGDGRIMLITDIKNNTAFELTNLVVAYAGFTDDGTPVKLLDENDTEGYYVQEISMGSLTVEAGEYWVGDLGYALDQKCSTIERVEAIVISCNVNGEVWTNPLYARWKNTFLGEKLEEWMTEISAATEKTEAVA
ncbi:MAG: hypothetical protein IKU48_05755 [Clostridia bacterium]|nr:hypothetical protein [Clostridia bacterium]